MKLTIFTYLKLKYYFKVFMLMRQLRPHITDKEAVEMYEYWEVVYRCKITYLLKDKYDKF